MALEDPPVELRGLVPRDVIDVLDAWSQAKGISRIDAANVILRRWALEKLHEHILFARVTKGNPLLEQAKPKDME